MPVTADSFPTAEAAELVRRALEEDLGPQHLDVTTLATIPPEQVRTAHVVARADGVVAGLAVVGLTMAQVARYLGVGTPYVELRVDDGDRVGRGDVLAVVTGRTQVVLVAERTLLNVLSRLSGVATHTRRWADALAGTGTTVLDTRKTTPGMRALEKYAVRAGGGTNKRMGLYDVAMVKDNHKVAAGGVRQAYDAVRATYPEVDVEVEVTTVAEALEAYDAGARFVMCDNMSVGLLRETVTALRARPEPVEVEATGGLTLEVARDYALTGVDFLSVGGLTHSSPILDIALDLVPLDAGDPVPAEASSTPLAGPSVEPGLVTRPLAATDRARWEVLHRGYTDFYESPTTDEQHQQLWDWLMAHDYGLEGLVVEQDGLVVGIAHVRPVVRPLPVTVGGYLDDLFVDPAARGGGAAAALLGAVRRLGRERGWSVVRWLTSETNVRARAFYEREGARATPFVTYGLDTD